MFYNLFSFKKKLNLCQRFVGQGFSLASKSLFLILFSPLSKGRIGGIFVSQGFSFAFVYSLYKSWKEGVFLFVAAKRQICLIILLFYKTILFYFFPNIKRFL
jgi:hypothetical protein